MIEQVSFPMATVKASPSVFLILFIIGIVALIGYFLYEFFKKPVTPAPDPQQ